MRLIFRFPWPGWWPEWLRTPALLILWAPLGFRLTCYYYRRSLPLLLPVAAACAVGKLNLPYRGERGLLVLQNLHRYFVPFALALVVINLHDTVLAFFFSSGFGIGLGTLILIVNVIGLAGYTFGCHSLRHLVGGGIDCFSCSLAARTRGRLWELVTRFNQNHGAWAWFSLVWIGFADFYVRLVATGAIADPRLILIPA